MSCSPPLWIVMVVQATSVVGDTLGQRSSRKYYNKSTRKMLFALTLCSGLQIFLTLAVVEIFFKQLSSPIYVNNKVIQCTQEVDINGLDPSICANITQCMIVDCPSQGPFEMWTKVIQHPFLWWNCLINIGYYVGEVLLYQEAFGLVFLVLASLTSSFCVAPLEGMFGIVDSTVPLAVLLLGIFGAMLCVLEKPVHTNGRHIELKTLWLNFFKCKNETDGAIEDESHFTNLEDKSLLDGGNADNNLPVVDEEDKPFLKRLCIVAFPFFLLSFVYSFWFTSQVIVNDTFHMNVFGFTSWDQVVAPFFMVAFLLFLDMFRPIRHLLFPTERDETLFSTMTGAYNDTFTDYGKPFLNLFTYRFMINLRAIAYFYLSTSYNLAAVYVELQMTRVVLSWLVSLVCGLYFPQFILLTEHERLVSFSPFNISLKMLGTMLIGSALFLLQSSNTTKSDGTC